MIILCRMALVGDALSHSVLPGLALAFLISGKLIHARPERHAILGLIQGHLAFLEPASGWVQIASLAKDGAERLSRSLWQYHDGEYRVVRREVHDFRAGGQAVVTKGIDKKAR